MAIRECGQEGNATGKAFLETRRHALVGGHVPVADLFHRSISKCDQRAAGVNAGSRKNHRLISFAESQKLNAVVAHVIDFGKHAPG